MGTVIMLLINNVLFLPSTVIDKMQKWLLINYSFYLCAFISLTSHFLSQNSYKAIKAIDTKTKD